MKPTLEKLPFDSLYSIMHCALFLPMVGNSIICFKEPLFNVAIIFDSTIELNLKFNDIEEPWSFPWNVAISDCLKIRLASAGKMDLHCRG